MQLSTEQADDTHHLTRFMFAVQPILLHIYDNSFIATLSPHGTNKLDKREVKRINEHVKYVCRASARDL